MATVIMTLDDPEWQPAEVNWDLYGADLNVSKMTIKRSRPTVNFNIPIRRQPPCYQPNSAAPSKPVDIRLDSDDHLDENQKAFIVDKVILPLDPFTELDDPRQRRAYYIIGWPDLPGARPVVDCTKALDYVSPCVIEEWEYKDFLRREEIKEKAEAEAAIAAVAAAIAAEKGKAVASADPRILPNGKKKPGRKPGRKPKNAWLMDARAPTPQLDSEQEEMLAKRRQGPSLSTPQKSRIAQLDAEMEMDLLDSGGDSTADESGDADEQVRLQLESGARSEITDSMDEDHGDHLDLDLLRANTATSGFQSSFRASSARPPVSANVPQSYGSSLATASTHAPSLTSSVQQHRASAPQRPSVPTLSSRLSQVQRPISTTPVPLPSRPDWVTKRKASSSPAQTIMPSIETRAPASKLATATLKPQPNVARLPSSSNRPPSSNGNSGFTPTNNFMPVGGYLPRPPKRAAEDSPKQITPSTATKGKTEHRKKVSKLSQPPPEPEPQLPPPPQPIQEYIVKRLEGDSVLDGVHWFRVRWEGDWPADQNPTWEPRANISAKLVKAYLKRKAEKEAKAQQQAKITPVKGAAASNRGGKQSTLKEWASKFNYGSVSEAFEGRAELDQNLRDRAQNPDVANDDDDDDDDDELAGDADEFLIVENKRAAAERGKADAERKKSLSAQLAADLANM